MEPETTERPFVEGEKIVTDLLGQEVWNKTGTLSGKIRAIYLGRRVDPWTGAQPEPEPIAVLLLAEGRFVNLPLRFTAVADSEGYLPGVPTGDRPALTAFDVRVGDKLGTGVLIPTGEQRPNGTRACSWEVLFEGSDLAEQFPTGGAPEGAVRWRVRR